AHSVISGSETSTHDDRELGNAGRGHRVHHFSAIFGDTAGLIGLAHHEARDVLQKKKRDFSLAAKLDEMRGFQGTFAKKNSIIAQNAHGISPDMGKPANKRRSIKGLKLMKARAVYQACDNFSDLKRLSNIRGKNA